jgi:hypothetical protein
MTMADTDILGPWTIKGVGQRMRETITTEARKSGLTVAQWLEKRLQEWVDDGMPERVSPGQPGSALVIERRPPDVHELAELVRLAGVLSAKETDTPLLREARGAVRARLRAFRPTRG